MGLIMDIRQTKFEPRREKTFFSGHSTRSYTNRVVHLQKTARGLRFRILKNRDCIIYEGKTKALIGCADVYLCFRICKTQVFLRRGPFYLHQSQ